MRFIIRKFVEAIDLESAMKKERRIKPFEIYIDDKVWEKRGYELKDSKIDLIGFKDKKLTK